MRASGTAWDKRAVKGPKHAKHAKRPLADPVKGHLRWPLQRLCPDWWILRVTQQ